MENNNLLIWESAVKKVEKLVEGTMFIPQQNTTGVTFFEGKQRLVKIVKTKKGLKMEINLEMSKTLVNKYEKDLKLTIITPAYAKQKHLGTMKYLFKDINEAEVEKIVSDLLKNYAKQQQN